MEQFKIRFRIFLITGAVIFMAMIPFKCFAMPNISESESRVYREKLVTEAKKHVGAPYIRGAIGPDAFDCSGLIFTVSRESIEFQLPRTVKAMYSYVKIVPDSQREPGDLVFFRTTGDGSISHVGLYIGKGQFISAVSDGPNTGVIVSSVNESYWKSHYASCGKFLPTAKMYDDAQAVAADDEVTNSTKGFGKFTDKLFISGVFTVDWNLFTEKRFMPNFRGLTSETDIFYKGAVFSPGLGIGARWNYGVGAFQVPLTGQLYFGDYVKVYAGPVFTAGTCYAPDTDDRISASIFPGVIGVTFAAPSFTKNTYKVQIIQDICYSVFNDTSNAALSPIKSIAAGLEFCTGVRVTFPFSVFYRR